MHRDFVEFAALFVQPEPPAFSVLVVVLHVEAGYRADPGKTVDHDPDQRSVPETDEGRAIDAFEEGPGILGSEDRCLSALQDVSGAADRSRGIHGQDLAEDEVIEEHAQSGDVLFDAGLGHRLAELFHVGGHHDGLNLLQTDPTLFAPLTESGGGPGVGFARMPVPDLGREEFEEPAGCLRTRVDDQSGQGGFQVLDSGSFDHAQPCHSVPRCGPLSGPIKDIMPHGGVAAEEGDRVGFAWVERDLDECLGRTQTDRERRSRSRWRAAW
jgi:hypothetical protein